MPRNLQSKIRVKTTLVTTAPLHVGGNIEDVDTDLPLVKDGQGRYYIPGTGLTGAIRDWALKSFPDHESAVLSFFGYQIPKQQDIGNASYLYFEDAVIEELNGAAVEIRDGVGIDRHSGTAVDKVKFDRAVLPRGAEIPIEITLEVPQAIEFEDAGKSKTDIDPAFGMALVAHLMDALSEQRIRFGAQKTRGYGAVKCKTDSTSFQIQDYSDPEQLIKQLAGNSIPYWRIEDDRIEVAKTTFPVEDPPVDKATISWSPLDSLMVKAGFEGVGADMLPLVSGFEGRVHLVLPGSSIKGAFRSCAEKIVRTCLDVGADFADRDFTSSDQFIDDVDIDLVNWLFGRAANEDEIANGNPNSGKDLVPGLAAVSFLDCYSKEFVSPSDWQAIVGAGADIPNDGDVMPITNAMHGKLSESTIAFHNAVDRWTGGAADGFLYTVLEPHGIHWEDIHLEINYDRLPIDETKREAAEYLLFLVFNELFAGRLPMGIATNRGFGEVEIHTIKLESNSADNSAGLQEWLAGKRTSWSSYMDSQSVAS